MINFKQKSALLVFFFVLILSFPAWSWDVDKPFDPEVHEIAKKALERLGPNRGAIKLAPSVSHTILGLDANTGSDQADINSQGLGLVSTVKDLEAAMKDLKAQETKFEIKIDLSSDVLFDFDKATIKDIAATELSKVSLIAQKKAKTIQIIGHTDAKGSDEYNQKLSEKRALSVKDWLVINGGISKDIITTKGLGELEPIAPNENTDGSDNPEGRAKNRRVEIIIKT